MILGNIGQDCRCQFISTDINSSRLTLADIDSSPFGDIGEDRLIWVDISGYRLISADPVIIARYPCIRGGAKGRHMEQNAVALTSLQQCVQKVSPLLPLKRLCAEATPTESIGNKKHCGPDQNDCGPRIRSLLGPLRCPFRPGVSQCTAQLLPQRDRARRNYR